ncbi:MAG: hypothetical protein M3137_17195 [Actinomycetota bacterium]|nr:hypothetical protein [Actinomycetota bacterium]
MTISGGTVTATTAPTTGLNPAAGPDPSVRLGPMSCPATGSCVAAGSYTDVANHRQGLIETFSGGTATPTTVPTTGLNPPAGTDPGVVLTSLSCPAAGSCVAVGNYTGASGNNQGLIETFSGGTATATTAPTTGLTLPAGSNPGLDTVVHGHPDSWSRVVSGNKHPGGDRHGDGHIFG